MCISVSYPVNVQELQAYGHISACETTAHVLVTQGKGSADEKLDETED